MTHGALQSCSLAQRLLERRKSRCTEVERGDHVVDRVLGCRASQLERAIGLELEAKSQLVCIGPGTLADAALSQPVCDTQIGEWPMDSCTVRGRPVDCR